MSPEIQCLLLLHLCHSVSTLTGIHASDERCVFKGSEASCRTTVADRLQADIDVSIDTCSEPVDITIHVQVARNLSVWSWRHSFVNPDETQPLSNLRSDISLHVSMKPVEATKLHVVAEFISHDHLQPFLDDFVDSRRHPCHMKDNPNALLPLVLFVVLVCLIAAGLVLLLCFRNHRHRLRMRRYLLPNMEVPTINPISDPQMPLPKPFTDQTEGNTCEETAQSQRSERRPMACHSLSVDTLRSEASHALSESPARENVGKKEDTQAEMNVFKSNRPPACSDLQFNESILDQRLPMGFQSEVAF